VPVHQQATIAVRKANVAHADETSWRVAGKKAWLWVLCTPLLEVFRIAKGRDATSCRQLLGRVFNRTLVTDRYSVYARFASEQQYCHTHLYRDWLKVEQRSGEDEEIGPQLRLHDTTAASRAPSKTPRETDAAMAAHLREHLREPHLLVNQIGSERDAQLVRSGTQVASGVAHEPLKRREIFEHGEPLVGATLPQRSTSSTAALHGSINTRTASPASTVIEGASD
jgi:hypothetical protein